MGSVCTGVTTHEAGSGYGDYIEVANLQPSIRTSGSVVAVSRINGEVFILPLEGSGSFTTKMTGVTAVGHSNILPVQNLARRQVLQVDNSNIDFNIGRVFIHMNNLFNGENKLLADTVNKFLNYHGQEVLKEVKPKISRQLTQLVTRVMNDAFSELPADKLLTNLNRSARSGHSMVNSGLNLHLHHPL